MTQNVEAIAIRTQKLAQLELDAYIARQAATVVNEELLDKPFDELTHEQWQQLKAYDGLDLAVDIYPEADTVTPEIEIDSAMDDFGLLYRVWHGSKLLGTFYRADADGKWVAQSCRTDVKHRCNTSSEAQLLILAINGLLVADNAA